MNTRAHYWATTAIIKGLFTVTHLAGIMFAIAQESLPGMLAFLGLGLWCSADMHRALDKMKAEANRDTALGLTGPASKGDLL